MTTTRPSEPARRGLVLLVDDDRDTREMYAVALGASGYAVVEAADGAGAVARTAAARPDAVVMDLALPGTDGWEATRQIRALAWGRGVPVVALSGHVFAGHAERARAAGCDVVLTKPCLPDALVAEVDRVLATRCPGEGRAPEGGTK